MPQENEQELLNKLIGILQEAINRDEQLRQTHQVGDKFRFIRDRLQSLMDTIQKETVVRVKKIKAIPTVEVAEDETLVYVHLYNAQGASVKTWQSMITPKSFFDFSVNRPIYSELGHVQSFIRAKANKVQHAYLTIAMKRVHILPPREDPVKDTQGNIVIKVKEGALHFDRTVSFTHNDLEYRLSEEGELIKKV